MALAGQNHYADSTKYLILFAERVEIFVRQTKPEQVKDKAQHKFDAKGKRNGAWYLPKVGNKGMEAWLRHNRTNYDAIWKENNLKWFSDEQQGKVREVLHHRIKGILVDKGLLQIKE